VIPEDAVTSHTGHVSAEHADPHAVAAQALDWLVDAATVTDDGIAWGTTRSRAESDPNLYGGGAGNVMALLEAHRHFDDDRFADVAIEASQELGAALKTCQDSSLYFGVTGIAVALWAVHDTLGDADAHSGATDALNLVRDRFDGEGWGDRFELLAGNAGVALGALYIGDLDLAVMAVAPYLKTAEKTAAGVHWAHRKGVSSRLHHISHGTLGIVEALAAVGAAAQRDDLVELALAGASDVVSRSESTNEGFLVPHSDPPYRPELIERISYGWCHGPAGDAQVFRLLAAVTGDPEWMDLTDRCWHTVVTSGLPERIRPGFWDNSGRCCGTAGVLAFACDRHVERAEPLNFASVLVDDICSRATIDNHGLSWSNFEHRTTPSDLEPRVGWAMGNAGIIRELLRFSRLEHGGFPDYFVAWPDQPGTGPSPLGGTSPHAR
jgi:lantibiotic modifying enzyme